MDLKGLLWPLGKDPHRRLALWRRSSKPGTRRVCDVPDGQRQRFCLELAQEGALTPLQYTARRLAAGIDKGAEGVAGKAQVVKQTAREVAEGTPVYATTVVKEATAQAQAVVQTMKSATVADAQKVFEGAVQQGAEWLQKPAQQQVGDVVEGIGSQGVTAPLSAVALGGAGQVVGVMGEGAAAVRKVARAAPRGNKKVVAARAVRATEIHHLLPRQFKTRFQKAGLDIEKFKVKLDQGKHRLKPDGVHTGPNSWN